MSEEYPTLSSAPGSHLTRAQPNSLSSENSSSCLQGGPERLENETPEASSGSTYEDAVDQIPSSDTEPSLEESLSRKLIVIPSTAANLGSPFLRAYPPSLAQFDISREVFLEFIDRLNRASVASPPVEALSLAGSIVSFVPLPTAQIVGTVVNAAATATTIAISEFRSDSILRQANRELFAPRGLRIYLAKLDAVAQIAGIPILTENGKIDKKASILTPFEADSDLVSLSAQQRRLIALEPWIAPLEVESLPEIQQPTNPVSRMHTFVSERQRSKEEKKLLEKRSKMQEEWMKSTRKAEARYEKDLLKLERKMSTEEDPVKAERRLSKMAKEYEGKIIKTQKNRKKGDKEEDMLRKLLFLIVQKDHGEHPKGGFLSQLIG